VSRLPESPRRERVEGSMVHVATAPNEAVAYMWAGALEDNGIHCMVKAEDMSASWFMPRINAFHRIHVLASEADRAVEILDSLCEAGEDTASGEEDTWDSIGQEPD
jgi:hypothetical protein